MDVAIRSTRAPGSLGLRTNGTAGRTLFGHFSKFNAWYEVNSIREGHFLERVAPGAFSRAFKEQRSQIRVMFEHGQDPTVGQKPLGSIVDLREDRDGAYYEVELFDASYVNDLIPAMQSDQMGASFRFSIPDDGDEWNRNPRSSAHNPERLPERTITNTDLFEFGPVVWGASPTATSGVRSGTDGFFDCLLNDPRFVTRLTERVGARVVEGLIDMAGHTPVMTIPILVLPPDGRSDEPDPPVVETPPSEEPADGGTNETPEATVDDQTEGNRNQIAAALARFRQTNRKET